MGDAVALLTAFVLACYLLAIADEVGFDLYGLGWFHWRDVGGLSPERILSTAPKHLAVMVPAWHEAGTVGEMIEATQRLMSHPPDKIDFFVGVYPNDDATREDVEALCRRSSNVHCVVNWRPGPTTKSQNLNFVFRAIERFEEENGVAFAGVAVHDAEDVIHPYAFRLYGALLEDHVMVQLPVQPLLPQRGFWRRVIAGTYADEFAEQHLHHVPIRQALGLFVPSAGTGFVLRRDVLGELASRGPIFHEEALTEDYELALRLWTMGHRVHFHLQRVCRIDDRGRTVHEYVGVKEHFPQEAAAAIRQKGRWIYGVTLQVPRLLRPETLRALSGRDRATLWRDQKGKYTNLVHLIGYPLVAYALAAWLLPLPLGEVGMLWPLALFVLAVTLLRLCMRSWFVARLYGWRQGLWAGFLPPLLPLRWLVGNYLNTRATLRAWRLYFFPGAGATRSRTPAWDKTAHKGYVDEGVLNDTRRRLGDDLIFFGDVQPADLALLVRRQKENPDGPRLGRMAVEQELVSEGRVRFHVRDPERRGQDERDRPVN